MTQEMTIRRLMPEDASELNALIQRCYGDSYGPSFFNDTAELAEMISTRKLCSVVADTGHRLVGHMGMSVRYPESLICETGNTVVDKLARGQGLLVKLGMALHQMILEEGYVGYVHYPTTAHHIMQRASVAYGGKETGVMLAYVSETTETKLTDKPSPRRAATVVYQPLSSTPSRQVVLPSVYRSEIERLYANLNLDRAVTKIIRPLADGAKRAETKVVVHYCAQRRVLHLFYTVTDVDFEANVKALIKQYQPVITQIDLPLDNPDIDSVVSSLNGIGFFFCALLPEFAHTDVLRLQAIKPLLPEHLALNLINKDAIRLGKFICESAR